MNPNPTTLKINQNVKNMLMHRCTSGCKAVFRKCVMRISSYRSFKKQSVKSFIWQGVILAVVLVVIGGGLYAFMRQTEPAHAANTPMTFSLFATHPYASKAGYDNSSTNYYTGAQLCPASSGKTFCPVGQTITDMNITDDGQLVAGYGDWNSNVDSFGVAAGRVGVVPLNLADGTWGDMFYAGSEAFDVIRKIDGKLYIPTTDPSDRAATSNPRGNISGYITNETGSWRFVSDGSPSNIHVLDVATLNGTDRYTAGSNTSATPGVGAGAVIKRSTDGGTTWQESTRGLGGSYNRFYAMASLDGKLYAREANAIGITPVSFDGSSWEAEPNYPCTTMDAKQLEVFNGNIVCPKLGGVISTGSLYVFDGVSAKTSVFKQNSGAMVGDLYVTDDFLYVLTTDGEIYRTNDINDDSAWQRINAVVPDESRSIAVYDGYIYLGGDSGQIFKSSLQAQNSVISLTSSSCFVLDSIGTILDYYDNEDNDPANPACPRDVIIPDAIDGVVITAIGDRAFYNNNNRLTSVTIPDSVTTIGHEAFFGNNLTSVTIPDSVTTIGSYAFSGNRLTSVTIPDSVTTIGNSAFQGNSLTSVELGSSVTTIGESAFSTNSLTSVVIPDSVTTIGSSAFNNNKLTSVTISDSVTTIGSDAFSTNNLTSVVIPDSVTTIGSWAFNGNSLTSVIIEGNPTLGPSTFAVNGMDRSSGPWSINSASIVHIYATNPDFIAENPSKAYLGYWGGMAGAFLTNPASTTVKYVTSNGTELNPPQTIVGTKDGQPLTSYTLTKLFNPEGSGNVADADFSQYFIAGDTLSPEVPSFDGYVSPDQRSIVLTAGETNTITYVYLTQDEIDAGVTINPDGSVNTPENTVSNSDSSDETGTNQVGAPNTGIGMMLKSKVGVAIGLIILVLTVAGLLLRRKRASMGR